MSFCLSPISRRKLDRQESTGANLLGSCVLVGQETSPTDILAQNRFLPPDIHTIMSSSSPSMSVQPAHVSPSSTSKTKKELYLALSDNPVLIEHGKLSFSLDKWSGKKCYMIAERALSIVWGADDTPQYWKWISIPDSRFEEVAELVDVCWLEIHGKIETRMMSPSTLYKAYLVFKTTAEASGLELRAAEVTVGLIGKHRTNQKVFLGSRRVQGYHMARPRSILRRIRLLDQPREISEAQYPEERNDRWLEIEMGEFFCEGGEGGELEMSCLETEGGHSKSGLIVQGIEIRPKGM